MGMGRRARAACGAAVAAALLAVPAAASALPPCDSQHWVGAWAADPTDATHNGFAGQTLREIVTPHMGGAAVRVHLTNRFGSGAVTFDSVTIARRTVGAAVLPGSLHAVQFGGLPSVTIAPGADAVSDPVEMAIAPFEDLAVSLYSSAATGAATEHFIARQTSWASSAGAGDRTRDVFGGAFGQELSSWYFLSGIDVMASAATGAIATFGDSITDGFQGDLLPVVVERRDGFDQKVRYPDFLARRLLAAGTRLSVLNDGVTGNRLLADGLVPQFGPSGLARLDADVLRRAGVTTAVVLLGINDIGYAEPPGSVGAGPVEAGYRELIARMHGAGVRVLLGTLLPTGRSTGGGHGSDQADAVRREVNEWIRSSGTADAVVDFDAALRDPGDPRSLAPRYDSGDHIHPNPAGYRRMAEVVDLATLAHPRCALPKQPARKRAKKHRRHKHRRHHARRHRRTR
jgi:lysophospholipase L1-like esterase